MARVDLHVHSSASFDSSTPPERVVAECRRLGFAPVFLTDHDTVLAAVRLRALGDHRIVVGEEIMTTDGELIGLFLDRVIRGAPTPVEAAAAIHKQGGLVYLEHPYDSSRRHLSEDSIEELANEIDIVEVFNGRSDPQANQRAKDLCVTLGAAAGAGSDAHTLREIGSVFIEMDDFDGPQDFLTKLRGGKIIAGRSKLRLSIEARLGNRIRRP